MGTLIEAMNKTCFTISTREDEIVEGTESIVVVITFTNMFGSFIFPQGGNETTVYISDNDGKILIATDTNFSGYTC